MFSLYVNNKGKVTKLVDNDGNTRQFKVKRSENFDADESNSEEGGEASDDEDELEEEYESDDERVVFRLISSDRSRVMRKMAKFYDFKQAICTIGTTQQDFRFFPTG